MKLNIVLVMLLCAILGSCKSERKILDSKFNKGSYKLRAPSSVQKENTLVELLNEIERTLSTDINASQCHNRIEYYWVELFKLDADSVDLNKMSNQQMQDYIQRSFNIRLGIKEKMKALKVETDIEKKCLVSIKRAFTALRYVEDYLIEFLYLRESFSANKDEFLTLSGNGEYFLVNKKYKFFNSSDLRPGDVILSRGNAFSSAAIARIGKTDTQFSHLSLVHEDEKGWTHTTEAHIEIGNVVAPIKKHLDQKNARTVVFRHKNEKLARLAGKISYDHVKKAQDSGVNIEYDFAMDYKDSKRLFCSEVVSFGYKKAAEQLKLDVNDIPRYKTSFEPSLLKFLMSIGVGVNKDNIKSFQTFGPGDIQFDEQFDIVAEWRNPKKLRDSRFKDAILNKLFDWMENEGYAFDPSFGTRFSSRIGHISRKNGFLMWVMEVAGQGRLDEQFPLNMKKRQIDLFVTLDKVGEYLYSELDKREKSVKRPLSMRELFNHLEKVKSEDLKRWGLYKKRKTSKKKVKFHLLFHP